MGLKEWFKQKTCKHDIVLVWEEDYNVHILGKERSKFRNIQGSPTLNVCRKCGHVTDGPFIKCEEEAWADAHLVSRFN